MLNERYISAATATLLHIVFFVVISLGLQGVTNLQAPPKFIKLRLGQSASTIEEIAVQEAEEIEETPQVEVQKILPEFGEIAEESAIEEAPKPKKAAPAKAEGSEFGNSDSGQKSATYLELLQLTVQETSQIPAEARADGLRGDAVLRLTFNRDGYVRKFELVQKTGHKILDEAALDVGAKLSYQPFPPMPDNFERGKRQATYDFPISFKP